MAISDVIFLQVSPATLNISDSPPNTIKGFWGLQFSQLDPGGFYISNFWQKKRPC